MARTASKPPPASSSAAAVLASSADDAAFATTLAKGLVVLEAFKAGTTQLGNMELSTLTGLPRPTVARLTHTLAELGYLRYDAERAKYRVGARALRMAHPLLADMQFRQVARPMMMELAQSVRGTVSIGLLDGTSMIYVETARSGDVGPHVPDIGMPIPVVMTAMGRAAAATLPPADAALLEQQIASEDAELWSAFRDRYRAGRAQCASRGFCTCWGEYMASIHAVAAPLFHADETRRSFSINCGIPAFRLQPGQLEAEIGPRIAALADSIRAIVGAAGPAAETQKQNKKRARK
ncbi:IclR family transcriptional regulator [Bradyrhizobium diazoefficiens]|uniref:IclR family transcriptional regulator n=1 Tax=Bradyrhizobium TaxID=374 RepID=UPI00045710F7|nr:IclR family transcriptional regulator [Bradyrhizobium diazoefficiens]APO52596.1 IclR family transcriptional regulator [Bradyrhizobium diazoefficiens]KOY08551.1 IclR family transcriptional regulator [Bradyrhizobium diazoefficiens]MCD9294720.1 IclR family transcriptional regulator [Bradyrhizobium diazoefficiens]MCD9810825.1 IclR family transcriptional regulator [Bradyrhizobium diazoefficiens]MCD9828689.1 IclR family transcriptional regulator [Bradyrhizobium diazoefficiens]